MPGLERFVARGLLLPPGAPAPAMKGHGNIAGIIGLAGMIGFAPRSSEIGGCFASSHGWRLGFGCSALSELHRGSEAVGG